MYNILINKQKNKYIYTVYISNILINKQKNKSNDICKNIRYLLKNIIDKAFVTEIKN